ncbi:MAG TPA: DPP IV N-terminal domain-containing protein, partial [Steroidobacteraceae bacterium]
MRLARRAFYCLHFILLAAMCSAASAEKLTIERLFAAPDLSGASLRSPRLSPDGRLVTYLRGKDSNKDRLDLWAYDIASHQHRLLVDSAVLAPQEHTLSAEEEARRERQRTASLSGIVEYEFSPDSQHLLVPLGGDLYVYNLQAPPERAVRRLTSGARYETDAHFSPHGAYVSFVRDQNLVVYDLAHSTERPITHDGGGAISYGTAEFIAQEEMDRTTGYWWAPDEKSIAFTRVDAAPVAEVDRFEIYADSVKVIKQRYPAAGTRNAAVQLFVHRLEAPAGSTPLTQVDLGTNTDIYLARVNWLPHGAGLAVQRQSRDQKTLTLLKVDPASGKATELLTEHSDTWVDLQDELTFLDHSPRFIWASSRSGFKHLYLYDL